MLPGQTLRATVALSGAATGTPTAKLLHNGVNDSGVTPTVAAGADPNEWAVSAVIPTTGYVAGDTVEFSLTATVSGVPGSLPFGRAVIETAFGFSTGVVSASPSPTLTGFTATGASLNTTAGGYTVAPMSILWQTGPNAGFRYPIAGHTASGSNHAFVVATMAVLPTTGNTFVIV